jgi:hypothetical protein
MNQVPAAAVTGEPAFFRVVDRAWLGSRTWRHRVTRGKHHGPFGHKEIPGTGLSLTIGG